MKCFKMFLILFATMTNLAVGMSSELTEVGNALEGYTIVDLNWTGPVVKGGPDLNFIGDAEMIVKKILEVNPDFPLVKTSPDAYELEAPEPSRPEYFVNCDPHEGWYYATVDELTRQADFLKSLGKTSCIAAGEHCARVSCAANTAVYYCNKHRQTWGMPCKEVGDLVSTVIRMCGTWKQEEGTAYAKGVITGMSEFDVWAGEAQC